MKKDPLILEIKGNSLDDGPGIRSVVFFKGCPLDCVWCHNPESKKRCAEISFDEAQCIGCDSCLKVCSENALNRKNVSFIQREKCTLCFVCEDSCPSGAISRVGKKMSVIEILDIVKRDLPFYKTSGGGVTLSGGEPTIDLFFTSELMKELKKEEIQILIETCGFFRIDQFLDLIYPYSDIIYYDIKILDIEDHKRYCGTSNEIILSNFIKLHEKNLNGGVEILPRTPLIPEITDTEKNISQIAEFYLKHNVKKAALLSYNPLWHEKNLKIGVSNPYSEKENMLKWSSKDREALCKKIFIDAGLEII